MIAVAFWSHKKETIVPQSSCFSPLKSLLVVLLSLYGFEVTATCWKKHPDCSLQLPWLSWGFCLFWGSFFDLKSLTEGWGLPGFFWVQKWTRNDHKPRDAKFVSFHWAGGRTSRTRKLMKIGHQINWINESSSPLLGLPFRAPVGKIHQLMAQENGVTSKSSNFWSLYLDTGGGWKALEHRHQTRWPPAKFGDPLFRTIPWVRTRGTIPLRLLRFAPKEWVL